MNERLYTLRIRQNYPLDMKVYFTKLRIKQWYEHWEGQVYVSFSGGKDSTVLLDIVRSMYPEIPAVFSNTGLEYPEIVSFVKTVDNVKTIRPVMNFKQVIEKYGYPVVSKEVSQKISEVRTTKSEKLRYKRLHGDNNKYKSGKIPNKWQYLIPLNFKISHKCCDILKKKPFKDFEKQTGLNPIVGTMTEDSHLRKQKYSRTACNSFEGKIESMPLSFWTEDDVWEYIKTKNTPYSKIYDMGYDRTGCMFCMFGVHLEKGENRFQLMNKTHPKYYNTCINKLGCDKVLDAIDVDYKPVSFL